MNELIAVFIGGGTGSIIRYGISKWLGAHGNGFPTGTFVANILSCIVLGLAWSYFAKETTISPPIKALILVGFCGGFSTFSTFSLETMRLFQEGQFLIAGTYIFLSVFICVAILVATTRAFQ
ncbi:UNVERIFIED_CONTAM: hypothetical protein GTU68_021858 [Idotea baltica]|nr:hypothetical protein [Idotea baltica]